MENSDSKEERLNAESQLHIILEGCVKSKTYKRVEHGLHVSTNSYKTNIATAAFT